jgi:hypothetical protein
MDDLPQSTVHLKRAVSVLPADSAWWRSTTWRLGSALALEGKDAEALDFYIRSYKGGQPDPFKYGVIETLYKRVNGSEEGLEAKVGAKPADSAFGQTVAQATPAPAVPTFTPEPAPAPTPEATAVLTATPAIPKVVPLASPEPTPEPKETATPQPTPEKTPEPSPSPTPEPTPERTLEPSTSPTPESTPQPTPEPTPARTPEPAPSPTPDPTPQPTPESTPEATPSPTPTPVVDLKPSPTPVPSPEPSPVVTPEPSSTTVAENANELEKKPSDVPSKSSEKPVPSKGLVSNDLFPPVVITIPAPTVPKSISKQSANSSDPPADAKTSPEVKEPEPSVEQKPEEKKTPEENAALSGDPKPENPNARPRFVQDSPKPPAGVEPCTLTASEDNIILQNAGGNLAIIIGRQDNANLDKISAVSSSPADVTVRREIINGVKTRALFVIASKSTRIGVFNVAFEVPCGRKVVVVRVR